jgi:hypothetical protein
MVNCCSILPKVFKFKFFTPNFAFPDLHSPESPNVLDDDLTFLFVGRKSTTKTMVPVSWGLAINRRRHFT